MQPEADLFQCVTVAMATAYNEVDATMLNLGRVTSGLTKPPVA